MLFGARLVATHEFERRSGWTLLPEGLCRDDRCVPLPVTAFAPDGRLDVVAVAGRLNAPVVRDEARGLWCVGPEAGVRPLSAPTAPDLTLPDLDGGPFHLAALRGRKVFLLAWASW